MGRRTEPTPLVRYSFSAVCATVLMVGFAAAQPNPIENRGRESTARTTVGAPFAVQCAEAAAAGRADDEAAAICDRAITERLSRVNLIATQINRGSIYMRRQDGRAALDAFDAVLEQDDDNAAAHLNRGVALILIGQPGPAVEAITTAISLGVPEPHKAYYNRARAREDLGAIQGAYEDYRTALEIQPDWGPANAELARFARIRRDQLAELIAEGDEDEPPAPAPDGSGGAR